MRYAVIESPIGDLLAARDDVGLTEVQFPAGRHPQVARTGWVRDDAAFDDVRDQFARYFAGSLTEFDLPLNPVGTAFQKRVWAALVQIPYGETRSYGKTAVAIGVPSASRAVGLANGRNPIPIIVPCHRVIGANGSLTGFAGGLDTKRWLLSHELQHAGLFAS